MPFTKHVNEKDTYAFEFKNVLDTDNAETLSTGTENVVVARRDYADNDNLWTDVTSEFGALGESINGTKVEFTLNEAPTDGDQEGGLLVVQCEVDTSAGRTLVDAEQLDIELKGKI